MVKSKEDFMKDLEKVYSMSNEFNDYLNSFYKCFENEDLEKCNIIDSFLSLVNFELNSDTRVSMIRKLVTLRDDYLVAFMESAEFSSEQSDEVLSKVFELVSDFHLEKFEEMISKISDDGLLDEFYREIFKGVHFIGEAMNSLDVRRSEYVKKFNEIMISKFEGSEKTVKFILENDLMEKFSDGSDADRSYSVLVEDSDSSCGYSVKAYANIFSEEVELVCFRIDKLISQLSNLEDSIFGLKDEWISYFTCLKNALSEKECSKLIDVWRELDYVWMKIDCPIQVTHPMEYYDDILRKSVQIEFDLRIVNPNLDDGSVTLGEVGSMFKNYMSSESSGLGLRFSDVDKIVSENLGKIQTYIGKPFIYYGRFFDGLFSAQVIPNDETVSIKTGKKIFAFADFILETSKVSPVMKIDTQVFGEDFIRFDRNIAVKTPDVWFEVYSISTLGHEFGHILWKGEDTEVLMDKSGCFKNIEEYKATTGGLVGFFKSKRVEEFWEAVFYELVFRSIKLIARKKVTEVVPYYCEGLVHLTGLFEVGVLAFSNGSLKIDMSREKFNEFSGWCIKNYEDLFSIYLERKDASLFLYKFCVKDSDGFFMPVDSKVFEFVSWFYELYEKIGREEDSNFIL